MKGRMKGGKLKEAPKSTHRNKDAARHYPTPGDAHSAWGFLSVAHWQETGCDAANSLLEACGTMSVALLYDPLFLEHETGAHPENAGRLRAVQTLLRERGRWEALPHLEPAPAPWDALRAVHDRDYLEALEQFAQRGGGELTPDTGMSPRSFAAARMAAEAAIGAVEAVVGGEAEQSFALVRPPGHHARPGQAMGFCLLKQCRRRRTRMRMRNLGLSRVAVLDFDVHHGNGTEEIFYEDPAVFFFGPPISGLSGTGALGDTGRGAGAGFTLNVPLPEGVGDVGYLRVFDEVIGPALRRYRPELILVSAGYDAHWTNTRYLASIRMAVTVAGFAGMVQRIRGWAAELCQGRAAYVLEGGYDPTALAWSILATLDTLEGRAAEDHRPPGSAPDTDVSPIIAAVRNLHGL